MKYYTIDKMTYQSVMIFLIITTTFIVTTVLTEFLNDVKTTLSQIQNVQKSITVTITHNKGK